MKKIGGALVLIALAMLLASFTPWLSDNEKRSENPLKNTITYSQPAERGRALFLAKGCATCHQHDSLAEPTGQVSIGINLSHYRPDPDFVRRWLRDPAAIRPETFMPNLQLSETEIEALIAFLDEPPGASVDTDIPSKAAVVQPHSCAITQAPDQPFRPPAPYPADSPYEDQFWYGTAALWTLLLSDGVWQELPHHDAGYGQKAVWWREDYDWQKEPLPALTVTARRLDAAAPVFETSEATNGYHPDVGSFMLVGITIPTPGCWQITAEHQGHELSYIVQIAP